MITTKDLSAKLGKHIATVSRLRHFVSREVLLLYYNFYVKRVIQYGILVYGGTYLGKLEKISILQRKFFRLLFFKRYRDNVDSEMLNNNILTAKQLYVYEIIKFAFKSIRKELATDYANNVFVISEQPLNTRGASRRKYVVPITRNNWEKFSLKSRGSKVLNFLHSMNMVPVNIMEKTSAELKN